MRTTSSLLYGIVSALSITVQADLSMDHFESVRLGGYVAQNCKSNIQNLSSVLLSLQDALKPVLADLKSKRPSAAYKAFFKKAAYAPYVRKIFSNLLGPVAVTTKSHSTAQTPIFVCIDSLEQLVWDEKQEEIDAYDFCTSDSLIPAAMILPTPYIIICPMFFEEPAIPTVTNTSCMSLDPKEPYLFTYDGRSPVEYQPWHLLHELVHFYVYASKDTYKDFYGVNECIYLKGRTAILNPQSYSYYAANLRLGCTIFPKPNPRIRAHGDELLEVWDNETAAAANESVVLVGQTVSVITAPPAQTSEPAIVPNFKSRGIGRRRIVYG